MKIETAAARFLRQNRESPIAITGLRGRTERWVKFFAGEDLRKITRSRIIEKLEGQGESSAQIHLVVLSRIFKAAKAPWPGPPINSRAGVRNRFLSDEEIERLESVLSTYDRAIVRLLLETGVHCCELFEAAREDVDLAKGFLWVRTPHAHLEARKTPLNDAAKDAMKAILARFPGGLCTPIVYPFGIYGPSPRPIVRRYWGGVILQHAVHATGIAGFFIYTLRDTAARLILQRGGTLDDVQDQLGYCSFSATDQRYRSLISRSGRVRRCKASH